ncbi:ribosome biogenesis GTP-binding protein YihA/YsxC [Mesoplasma lactucae]|uniref:Probable GTP-binding protein EngB n=1 Tax=Mesoplasma lactucae ATCC 49193 TaxID=81460 RepID=A0A291IRQ8_9MOLU|nr:ribosome biogenesis GTP-binding protein YihA/YsxC [Mesoplasma lactucae]ATG97371.1 YihA family ribosome biogenesis GTP-binding protein [Mesoplasma lactucae ATCC 49193]ATZ20177.1 GTP-binding protein [Mesoplasma lactucae ATCC 49193]MCL8216926.1 putative GTP-binding protein EngB [Mesoplasma lactucae ATCC 49193]
MEQKVKWSEFIKSAAGIEGWIDDDIPEVLFVGRSNVGKSSFINALTNNKKLAKISSTPGKTRLLNFFDINKGLFRIVDAPGYGYAKVNGKMKEQFSDMMNQYMETRPNLKLVVMLVDLRHKPTTDDLGMYKYLKYYQLPVVVVGTKLDKLKQNEIKKNEKMIRDTLELKPSDGFIKISNTDKRNVNEVYDEICKRLEVNPEV